MLAPAPSPPSKKRKRHDQDNAAGPRRLNSADDELHQLQELIEMAADELQGCNNDVKRLGGDERETSGDGYGPWAYRKRKQLCKAPRHSWGSFLKLQALELPAVYEQHLQKNGTDAIRFINDRNSLENDTAQYEYYTVGDAFIACYYYTQHLDFRHTMNRARWYFTILMYFNLVKYIRPNGFARVGYLILKDIKSFLGPILSHTTYSADLALKQLNERSRCGYKLSLLCR